MALTANWQGLRPGARSAQVLILNSSVDHVILYFSFSGTEYEDCGNPFLRKLNLLAGGIAARAQAQPFGKTI